MRGKRGMRKLMCFVAARSSSFATLSVVQRRTGLSFTSRSGKGTGGAIAQQRLAFRASGDFLRKHLRDTDWDFLLSHFPLYPFCSLLSRLRLPYGYLILSFLCSHFITLYTWPCPGHQWSRRRCHGGHADHRSRHVAGEHLVNRIHNSKQNFKTKLEALDF